jgi:hypothetical protein
VLEGSWAWDAVEVIEDSPTWIAGDVTVDVTHISSEHDVTT